MSRRTPLSRASAFSLVNNLVAIGVVIILMGMMSQGVIWAKYQAEIASLKGRAGQFATALQLYYQDHRVFPSAYPADLKKDLTPYIDDDALFTCPAHPDAGAEPLNLSYVTPVASDISTYVLSIDSQHDSERSVVLYVDSSVDVVQKLPVSHGSCDLDTGDTVRGGSIAFADGSTIELSGNTAATLCQSFVARDGTHFHVVKTDAGDSSALTAVAVDSDIIELASDAGVTYLRGGVADIQLMNQAGEHLMKVAARSGEVLVKGRLQQQGQLVEHVIENTEDYFTVDDDHSLVATNDCIATIRVLGKAITYGAGGPDCAVQAGAKFGSENWDWLFNGAQVYGGEEYSRQISAGTRVSVEGRASYGSWSRTYKSTVDHRQVLVLVDGDTPPQFAPFDGQPEITSFCSSVIDAATGKVTIEKHQAVFLFELGTTNMSSSAADFQDLVLLVDFARIPTQDRPRNLTGSVNINPSNNNDFEFTLTKPDGSTITRDHLLASSGDLQYEGPALSVKFRPKGNGNNNSLTLNGSPYDLQNGHLYTITATDMTLYLDNDHQGNGNAMGRWWMSDLCATDAQITDHGSGHGNGNGDDEEEEEDQAPTVDDFSVTIDDANLITVREDCSVAVRALGTSLKNQYGNNVPIAMKIKVNDSWKQIKNGRAVSQKYLYKTKLSSGDTLALKFMSYNGWDSASYHSADGTGHVLMATKGRCPARLVSSPPDSVENFLNQAIDPNSYAARVGKHQILMLCELGIESPDDPAARFQDIAVALTFIPQSLHNNAKKNSSFDGYQSGNSAPPMAQAAEAFAQANGFDWTVIRECDIPQNEEPDDEDNQEDHPAEDDPPQDDPPQDDPPVDEEDNTEYTTTTDVHRAARRSLERGLTVQRGRWITVRSYN